MFQTLESQISVVDTCWFKSVTQQIPVFIEFLFVWTGNIEEKIGGGVVERLINL